MSSAKEFRLTLPKKKLDKLKDRAESELGITTTKLINDILDSYLVDLADIKEKAIRNPEFYTPEKIREESYKIHNT